MKFIIRTLVSTSQQNRIQQKKKHTHTHVTCGKSIVVYSGVKIRPWQRV
jgi:hypothetical protein